MNHSEAGRIGGAKTRERILRRSAVKEVEYLLSPKICVYCNSIIPFKKKRKNFCSRICCVTYWRYRKQKKERYCKNCGKIVERRDKDRKLTKHCRECINKRVYNYHVPSYELAKSPSRRRDFIFKERGYKCEGQNCVVNSEWNGKPITLQLDHVDGNDNNWDRKNIKILCPNCHSQTPTWGRKIRPS